MRRWFSGLVLSFGVVLLPASSYAADSCQPVFTAVEKLITTPNHSYTTTSGVDGRNAHATETILAGGKKYIAVKGKWMAINASTQELLEAQKEKEKSGAARCQLLRNEAVNGDSAVLYRLQEDSEDVKEDDQIWISKSSGLPLREEQEVHLAGIPSTVLRVSSRRTFARRCRPKQGRDSISSGDDE